VGVESVWSLDARRGPAPGAPCCARGIPVPERLSIVGFDDMPFASHTNPSLTTVKMPIAEIVAAGVELAVGESDWPANGAAHPPRVIFQPRLIVRRSTAAITPAADDEP
jgi:DNA-binding LacI/PurR family transcriptional regulator